MFKFDHSIVAANDPIRKLPGKIKHWAKYTECKYEIAKDLEPNIIVEIGVRAGYSAWALLQANHEEMYYGFDANNNTHGGAGGPWSPIAEKMLEYRGYNLKMWHDFDSQTNDSLPIKIDSEDIVFYHIDGEHSFKGVYNDLELCFKNGHSGCFMLVDDYNAGPSLVVKQGTDKWIEDHKDLIKTKHFPNSGNGDMLIEII